jgi:chromosome segregation ATPase
MTDNYNAYETRDQLICLLETRLDTIVELSQKVEDFEGKLSEKKHDLSNYMAVLDKTNEQVHRLKNRVSELERDKELLGTAIELLREHL